MTMHDRQALWFLTHLNDRYPELIPKYEHLYGFSYQTDAYQGSYAPPSEYTYAKHKKLFELCAKYKLAYRMPRFLPDDYRRTNYIVAEKLLNEAYEKQMSGEDWAPLFWAGQNIQNLTKAIKSVAKRKELGGIRNVTGWIMDKVEACLRDAS